MLVALTGLIAGCNFTVKKAPGDSPVSQKPGGAGEGGGVGEEAIVFADVQPILLARCATCHHHEDDFKTFASTMSTGDVVAGNAEGSDLVARLKNFGGDMPLRKEPIPEQEANLIKAWIAGGALETAESAKPTEPTQPAPVEPAPEPQPLPGPTEPAPAPGNPPTPVEPAPAPQPAPTPDVQPVQNITATYSDLQAQVFSKKCTLCHNDKNRTAGFSLEHYNDLVSNARLIVKGDSRASGVYVSVAGQDAFMPPKRAVDAKMVAPLTDIEKIALQQWIDAGALEN